MMKLIDADVLMKEFSDFVRESNNSDFARTPTWNDAVSLVESMLSAKPKKGSIMGRTIDENSVIDIVTYECGEWSGLAKEIVKQIKAIPSAERKGHWKGYNADNPDWLRTDGSPIFMSCSECNGTVLNNGSAHWNYCPNCGARME